MYKIWIVEDDAVIATALRDKLALWGYETALCTDFEDVAGAFCKEQPQLVILDIMLPFFNGFYWCQKIREVSKAPILFLSSASDNMNIVMAINMGGDDFIAKPFDMTIVVAKVQALLRRAYSFTEADNSLRVGDVTLNLGEATILNGERKAELTRNELRILQLLMQEPGKVVTRDELMLRLWESDAFVDENTLTVNITRLRRKLEGIGLTDFIRTRKGLGYRLC